MNTPRFIKLALIICITFLSVNSYAQKKNSKAEKYIKNYTDLAINNMREFKIPASITMAQALLESGYGESELAKKSNNHFGIKCKSYWKGERVYHDDDAKGECFRKYSTVNDSFIDHGLFLTSNQRYSGLFKLKADDYKGWAKGLKAAGYATNPKYPELLINMVELYKLNKLDDKALRRGKLPRAQQKDLNSMVERITELNREPVADYIINDRKVYRTGKTLFVIARNGENFKAISKIVRVSEGKLKRYNKDIQTVRTGDMIKINNK